MTINVQPYNENFSCSKEQIMHRELRPYFANTIHKFFKNTEQYETDINSIENSLDQDPHCFP